MKGNKQSVPLVCKIDAIYPTIDNVNKAGLSEPTLEVDKKRLFFGGPNWSLNFEQIHPECIQDCRGILDDLHQRIGHESKIGKTAIPNVDFETLESLELDWDVESFDGKKLFKCLLLSPMDYTYSQRNSQALRLRSVQSISHFLTGFLKRYDKWEKKQQARLAEVEDDEMYPTRSSKPLSNSSSMFNKKSKTKVLSYPNNGLSSSWNSGSAVSPFSSTKSKKKQRRTYGSQPTSKYLNSFLDTTEAYMSGEEEKDVKESLDQTDLQNKDREERQRGTIASRSGGVKNSKTLKKIQSKMEKLDTVLSDDEIVEDPADGTHSQGSDLEEDDAPISLDKMESGGDLEEENDMVTADEVAQDDIDMGNVSHQSSSKRRRLVKKRLFKNEEESEEEDFMDEASSPRRKLPRNVFDGDLSSPMKKKTPTLNNDENISGLYTSGQASSNRSLVVSPDHNEGDQDEVMNDIDEMERRNLNKDATVTDEEESIDQSPNVSDPAPTKDTERSGNIQRYFQAGNQNETKEQATTSVADSFLNQSSDGLPRRSPRRPVKNPYKPAKVGSKGTRIKAKNDNVCIGLRNLGNTCYINSSLQMLFSVNDFIQELSDIADEICTTLKKEPSIPLPLTTALLSVARSVRIIEDRANENENTLPSSVDPSNFKYVLDKVTNKFVGFQQRDAHEFLSDLIDLLHDELVEATKEAPTESKIHNIVFPTDKFFRLNVKVCLKCDSCEYTRSKEEMYRHLSIEVGEVEDSAAGWSVDKGLQQFFGDETRELKCEKCSEGKTATQCMQIVSRPKAVLLHLKRFILSTDTANAFRKNKVPVSFESKISMKSYLGSIETGNDTAQEGYALRGVVRHIGKTANSGHYTADAMRKVVVRSTEKKDDDKTEKWISFDDGQTSLTSLSSVKQSQENCYMMMYQATA